MDNQTETKRIPIEEADAATLKHFAELALGLEVKPGTNGPALRAKITAAMPNIKDVPPIPAPPVAAPAPAPAGFGPPPELVQQALAAGYHAETEDPTRRPAAVSRPASIALRSPQMDPKVELTINRTDDKRRAREVTVEVNGYTCRMQRGQKVKVPLRIYYALERAKERQPVETDEINPITGTPIIAWEEVYSYPFMVHSMPSDEEIAAWHAATGSGFANSAALAA